MSQPNEQPEFFLDRCLGSVKLPQALRAKGFQPKTMEEYYGKEQAQLTSDEKWLAVAGKQNWVVLTKDKRIKTRTAEIDMIIEHRVRCFCINRGDLKGDVMSSYFIHNMDAIIRACQNSGPFVYSVGSEGIRKIDIAHELSI